MNHSPKIKKYVLKLILFFLTLSLAKTIFFLNTFTQLKINGPIYSVIKEYKDLKVDIYPPKLYIVEAYRLIQQTALPQYMDKIHENASLIEKSKKEYEKYHFSWKKRNMSETLQFILINDSHQFVEDFFHIYQEKFLPALSIQDYDTAQDVVFKELDPLFLLHKAKIDEASRFIDLQTISIEEFSERKTNLYSTILLIIYLLSIATTLFISITLFYKIKKNESTILDAKKETESLNFILEQNIQTMTRFKHNFDNTLASITGYAHCNDLKGLNLFLADLQMDHKDLDLKQYRALSSLKNHGLMGLVLSKIQYAKTHHVSFEIQPLSIFSKLSIKPHHLCEIIGILLDNAIEGALESSAKKIVFQISAAPNGTSFQISNSINKYLDHSQIFQSGFSTKGEKRGNGLGIAHKIVSSYPNVLLNTFIENHVFTQELIIH
jgi:hypothetical protein